MRVDKLGRDVEYIKPSPATLVGESVLRPQCRLSLHALTSKHKQLPVYCLGLKQANAQAESVNFIFDQGGAVGLFENSNELAFDAAVEATECNSR